MGLLRLFLALSVIAGHAGTTVFGFNGIGPGYAVNFFFIISGFYMAMVLNEKHKNTKIQFFYKSRALRLLPTYYIGIFIALLISFNEIILFFSDLRTGGKLFFIFQNLFVFGQDLSYVFCSKTIHGHCADPVSMTINPPAWSLALELGLGFYSIAPFILKSINKTFFFVIAGVFSLLLLNTLSFPFDSIKYIRSVDIATFSYYFYPASFIFFGTGALCYHFSKLKDEPSYLLAIITLVLLSFTTTVMPFWHLLFIGLAIPVLFNYTKKNRIDRFIGELSYPVYILHFPFIIWIKSLTKSHPDFFSVLTLGTWVAISSCILGIFIYLFIEKKINIYRDSIDLTGNLESESHTHNRKLIRTYVTAFISLPIFILTYIYCSQQ